MIEAKSLIWIFYFVGQMFMVAIIAQTAINSKLNGIEGWGAYFRARGLNVAARLFISLCAVMFLWSNGAVLDIHKFIQSSGAAAAAAGLVGFASDAVFDKINGVLGAILPGFHLEVPPK